MFYIINNIFEIYCNNNCLTVSCVRLYFMFSYIHILLFMNTTEMSHLKIIQYYSYETLKCILLLFQW
jgi:hypothetical protein